MGSYIILDFGYDIKFCCFLVLKASLQNAVIVELF